MAVDDCEHVSNQPARAGAFGGLSGGSSCVAWPPGPSSILTADQDALPGAAGPSRSMQRRVGCPVSFFCQHRVHRLRQHPIPAALHSAMVRFRCDSGAIPLHPPAPARVESRAIYPTAAIYNSLLAPGLATNLTWCITFSRGAARTSSARQTQRRRFRPSALFVLASHQLWSWSRGAVEPWSA